jgi:hypothetical protein
MQVAIGAIGIGVVLMVGYIVVSQVRSALPTSTANVQVQNPCAGYNLNDTTYCNVSTYTVGGETFSGPITDNTSSFLSVSNTGYTSGTSSVQVTVFAGFALIAVGIIVLAAFGLINVFQ